MKISICCMVLSAVIVLSLIVYTEATDGPVGMADFTPNASLEITNDGHGDTFLMGEPDYQDDYTPFVIRSEGNVGLGPCPVIPFVIESEGSVGLGITNPRARLIIREASILEKIGYRIRRVYDDFRPIGVAH